MGGLPRAQGQMEPFREVINYCGLYDLQYSGYPFTWSNGRARDSNIQSRLDRLFGNTLTIQSLPNIKVSHLQSSHSDHAPIMLELMESDQQEEAKRERPFRFEKMWSREEGFYEIIAIAWSRMGKKQDILEVARPIERMGRDLKGWNKNVFSNINRQIKEESKRMERLANREPFS